MNFYSKHLILFQKWDGKLIHLDIQMHRAYYRIYLVWKHLFMRELIIKIKNNGRNIKN